MGFFLKDKPFAIKSAELFASIPDPHRLPRHLPAGDPRPSWSLEVWVEGEWYEEETGDDEAEERPTAEARATAEEMRFPIRRWTDILGQTVEWVGSPDPKVGGPYGIFYFGEHEIMGRARLRFTERDGTAFRFEWEGACDVFWNEEYGSDVPFSTTGWAKFTGVTVGGGGTDTDETLRGRLAQYFDPHDFVQGPLIRHTYRHSFFRRIESSHAVFTPSDPRAA